MIEAALLVGFGVHVGQQRVRVMRGAQRDGTRSAAAAVDEGGLRTANGIAGEDRKFRRVTPEGRPSGLK